MHSDTVYVYINLSHGSHFRDIKPWIIPALLLPVIPGLRRQRERRLRQGQQPHLSWAPW